LTLSQNILNLRREDGKEKERIGELAAARPRGESRAASLAFFVSLELGAALNP
jgi:hypothetical protein